MSGGHTAVSGGKLSTPTHRCLCRDPRPLHGPLPSPIAHPVPRPATHVHLQVLYLCGFGTLGLSLSFWTKALLSRPPGSHAGCSVFPGHLQSTTSWLPGPQGPGALTLDEDSHGARLTRLPWTKDDTAGRCWAHTSCSNPCPPRPASAHLLSHPQASCLGRSGSAGVTNQGRTGMPLSARLHMAHTHTDMTRYTHHTTHYTHSTHHTIQTHNSTYCRHTTLHTTYYILHTTHYTHITLHTADTPHYALHTNTTYTHHRVHTTYHTTHRHYTPHHTLQIPHTTQQTLHTPHTLHTTSYPPYTHSALAEPVLTVNPESRRFVPSLGCSPGGADRQASILPMEAAVLPLGPDRGGARHTSATGQALALAPQEQLWRSRQQPVEEGVSPSVWPGHIHWVPAHPGL